MNEWLQENGGRFVGIDLGTESIKVVELAGEGGGLSCVRREFSRHDKEPVARLGGILGRIDWPGVDGAAACGRMGRQVLLPRIPVKQAQVRGYRLLYGHRSGTTGSRGSSCARTGWRSSARTAAARRAPAISCAS